MARKTFHEFAAPFADNVPVGPEVSMGDGDFDMKTSLITMVQASSFCAIPGNLQHGVTPDTIRLRPFLFFLLRRAKQWFYANRATVNTRNKCSTAFLSKFFPMGKTNALRGRISSFQQTRDETAPEAWERLQEYVVTYPHHGMDKRLILQTRNDSKPINGTEMLAAQLDLLMKRMDNDKKDTKQGAVKALNSYMTCEVCGNDGHSGTDRPKTRKDVMKPRMEHCSMGRIKYGPNPQNFKEVKLQPRRTDSLIDFMMNFSEREEKRNRQHLRLASKKPGTQACQPSFLVTKRSSSAPKIKKVWQVKEKTLFLYLRNRVPRQAEMLEVRSCSLDLKQRHPCQQVWKFDLEKGHVNVVSGADIEETVQAHANNLSKLGMQ
uniref:OSJNBb0045P24.1 protein n=1 Tax=Oryza sativa subsp. japonica TaxID=39947 RepID=Q7X6P7_ORYSJ|nr:OSJNBb0045P24.1 [Oryza sativa Japonica Group]